MKHWSVDTSELAKDQDAYAIWRLEQAINFGLYDGKLRKSEIKKYWANLELDNHKKKFLALLLT